jgi:hypothetical protein
MKREDLEDGILIAVGVIVALTVASVPFLAYLTN